MTTPALNRLATQLPLDLITTYFVANGIVYIYKTFLPNSPNYQKNVKPM